MGKHLLATENTEAIPQEHHCAGGSQSLSRDLQMMRAAAREVSDFAPTQKVALFLLIP